MSYENVIRDHGFTVEDIPLNICNNVGNGSSLGIATVQL